MQSFKSYESTILYGCFGSTRSQVRILSPRLVIAVSLSQYLINTNYCFTQNLRKSYFLQNNLHNFISKLGIYFCPTYGVTFRGLSVVPVNYINMC